MYSFQEITFIFLAANEGFFSLSKFVICPYEGMNNELKLEKSCTRTYEKVSLEPKAKLFVYVHMYAANICNPGTGFKL